MLENESGQFQCWFSKPNLRVRWKRNNRDIGHSEKYIIKADKEKHFLEVANAELKDEAEYTCDAGEVKTAAKLTVKGKKFLSEDNNYPANIYRRHQHFLRFMIKS